MGVGIDIGSKTVKVVELVPDGATFALRGAGIVGYSGINADQINENGDATALSGVIKKLFDEARISSKDVVIALPEHQVFTRTIKFPPLTDAEISSAVKWEAEEYIPIPISEAIIQHQILERKQDGVNETLVLLVAAPRVLVEKYVKIGQLAGLNPVAVETELIALVRGLAPSQGVSLLVDFGAKSTDIAIAKNGMLTFSRSIPTAGEAFTRAVSQTLGIHPQQAEEYKRTYGLAGAQLEGKIRSAIDPVFRVVTDEIKKAVHFYQTEEKGEAPSSVILSGGTAGMPEASVFLTKLLGIEVVIGNPFANIKMQSEVAKTIEQYAPLYAIAAGLAKRA